jgi:hypothetical protein
MSPFDTDFKAQIIQPFKEVEEAIEFLPKFRYVKDVCA